MKINWQVRFKNKAWVTAFVLFIISTAYSFAEMLGLEFPVAQDKIVDIVMTIVQLLTFMGILVDPTTNNGFMGIGDSIRAMGYDEPHRDIVEEETDNEEALG